MNKKPIKKIGFGFIKISISIVLIVCVGLIGVSLLSTEDSAKLFRILGMVETPDIIGGEKNNSDYDANGYDKTLRIDPIDINPISDFTLTAVIGGWNIEFYKNSTDKTIVIPNKNSTDGQPIVSIGAQAFHNMQLKSVIIPNSVTTIGDYAFWSNQLTSIKIPSSVTSIGCAAFNRNMLIESQVFIYSRNSDGTDNTSTLISYGGSSQDVTIPSSVTTIGKYAFNNIRLKSVVIPYSVTTIDEYAFYKNELASVTIPTSVTTIAGSAFRYNHLTSVTIPSSITSIGSYAFNSNMLTSVTFEGQVPTTLGVYIFENNIFLRIGSTKVPNAFLLDYQDYEVWHRAFSFLISNYIIGY